MTAEKGTEHSCTAQKGETLPEHGLLERAEDLCEHRFRFADRKHPAVRAMHVMGVRWCAQDLAACTRIAAPHAPEDGDGGTGTVDPLDLLRDDLALPSLPQVITELQQVIANPESSAGDVADVVSKDAGLSSFLLRLVNSAFYSFPSQIDTISRAVTVVGMQQLGTMAMGVSVVEMFREAGGNGLQLAEFWKHSLAVGRIARGLAEQAGLADAERFFVCGLLHDVGRLVLHMLKPVKAQAMLRLASQRQIPLYAAEAELAGFDHARLGGMLLRKWNFPFSLTMGVLYHHLPEKSETYLEPHIVHLADAMAKALGLCSSSESLVPPLSDEAWRRCSLTPADLYAVEADLRAELDELFGMLLH